MAYQRHCLPVSEQAETDPAVHCPSEMGPVGARDLELAIFQGSNN